LFHLLNHRITLLRAFGKQFQDIPADALDFKAVLGRLNQICSWLVAGETGG
jgi:hypothetical protein